MTLVWDGKARAVVDDQSDFSLKEVDLRPGEREFIIRGNDTEAKFYAVSISEDIYDSKENAYIWTFVITFPGSRIWKVIGSVSHGDLKSILESSLNVYMMRGNPQIPRCAIVTF